MNEIFACACGGEVKRVDATHTLHDCRSKYAPSGSYYTGIARFILYHRIQVNPKLTNGVVKYNWFVEYESQAQLDSTARLVVK